MHMKTMEDCSRGMRKKHKQKQLHGHYCKVCGEYKANEKFSGKGHAAHICKACATKPVAERDKDITLRKIEGMAFRYLSGAEVKWLRDKINDSRPEIQEAARMVHSTKFQGYERNLAKKGLTAFSLEFFIHGEISDEYGEEVFVHATFYLKDTGEVRRIDHDAPEGERETTAVIDKQDARRFLKSVIHELDALFWDEDLSDAEPGVELNPFCDDDEMGGETEVAAELGNLDVNLLPICSLRLDLNNGEEKFIKFYHQMHDEPQTLYWSLMNCFELEDEYGADEWPCQ